MQTIKRKINSTWLKASIVGSIWASFEIIVGSLLHNLRIPSSGTILTFTAVVLLISFARIWYEKGLILKAGIIAALMKSISPSAILIGPMTGIFLEALIIEIIIFLLGNNKISYVIASIFALYSVIIHKIISLLILYGKDIVKISKNLYYFIAKQLSISDLPFKKAIFILSLIYVFLGLIAAFTAIFLSQQVEHTDNKQFVSFKYGKNPLKKNENVFSVGLLIANFLMIILVFLLLNTNKLFLASVIGILGAILIFVIYQNSAKRLKRPGFWLQILLLLVISAMFYNGFGHKNLFSIEGLKAGWAMIIRMLVLYSGFSAISHELRNPVIKIILYRQGFGNLYLSLGLAFGLLPKAMELIPKKNLFSLKPQILLSQILALAISAYQTYLKENTDRKVIIISGEKGTGKTSFMLEIIKNLRAKGIKTGGFIALGSWKNNERHHFTVKNLITNEKKLLASKEKIGKIRAGRFFFDEKVFRQAETNADQHADSQLVLLDEVGPLELKGKGWSRFIEIMFEKNIPQVWTVRDRILNDVIFNFGLSEVFIFDCTTENPQKTAEFIIKKLIINKA